MSETVKNEILAARHMAGISIVVNLVLALVKGVAGVLSGSTALVGDAIHSGADVFASTAVFVGLWVAGRKHPSFPYGLYKAETVGTLVTAIVVILAGYEIGRQALLGSIQIPDVSIALPVTIGCFVVALAFGFVLFRAGRRLNSPSLEADGRDYLADSLSTGVVLVGLLASFWGWHIDRWAAAAVSVFVLRVGIQLLVSALRDLLDASMDREAERKIRQMVEACPQVTRVKRFLSRVTGGRFMVDMDIVLHTPSHQVADQVADRLEEDIVKHFPRVVMARVRPHFSAGHEIRRLTPVEDETGTPSDHFCSAPYFLVEEMDLQSGTVERRYLANPCRELHRKKGFKLGRWLLSLKPDQLIAPEGKENVAIALLEEAGVEILAKGEPVRVTLPLYSSGQKEES